MGDRIINLSSIPAETPLTQSDYIPVAPASQQGSTYKATLGQVLAFFNANFASPDFTVETAAPNLTGFTATIATDTTNVWLILQPTGTMAAGTVAFPAAADAFDGMTVLISTTQQITALTVTSTGGTFVGAPTTIGAGASVMFRFNTALLKWFAVNSSGGSISTFAQITLTSDSDTILDANGKTILQLAKDYVLPTNPNFVQISNGSTATIQSGGPGANADIALTGKGAGVTIIGNNSAGTSVRAQDFDLDAAATALVTVATTMGLAVTGALTITGGTGSAINVAGTIKHTASSTVAAIPSAVTAGAGTRRYVTDGAAVQPVGTTLTGGGALFLPVYSDGTVWRYG